MIFDRSVNTHGEWGEYVPNFRREIEPYGWDEVSAAGLGPCAFTTAIYCLVQRATASPHPIIWHSPVYETRDAAWQQELTFRIEEASTPRERMLRVPMVTALAFDHHHNGINGCGGGSVAECTGDCVEWAYAMVLEIVTNSRFITWSVGVVEQLARERESSGSRPE